MLTWWTNKKATSEDIPAGTEDLASGLEICDMIRSKSLQAKDVMRSFKRRISHRNPNVQILLIDLSVKNGGDHFLLEISSREFMDYLVSLLKANDISDQNLTAKRDVYEKILELIQSWAILFEKKPNLSYVCSVYQDLQSQGYNFPPKEELSSTFIDSFSPPEWSDSNTCMLCRVKFTFKNRKHHCRNCGGAFCQSCSSKSCPLLYMGITEPTRVCDNCYSKKTQAPTLSTYTSSNNKSKTEHSKNTNINDNKNLEYNTKLSLNENNLQKSKLYQEKLNLENHRNEYLDDSKELNEAISLSLKDMDLSKSEKTNIQTRTVVPNIQSNFEHELTSSEIDSINVFSMLITKLRTAPLGSILRDHQIQELHESVMKLKPKLIRSLGDTITKYEKLIDIHSKLSTVMKYYDKLLEDRLSTAYSSHTFSSVCKTEIPQTNKQIHPSSLAIPSTLQPSPSEYHSYYKNTQLQRDKPFYTSSMSQELLSSDTFAHHRKPSSHENQKKFFSEENISTISNTMQDLSFNTFMQNTVEKPSFSTQETNSHINIQNKHNLIYNNFNQSFHEQVFPQDKNDYSKQTSLIDL
ncbi:hypothetical protein PORY_001455 [Pneumocystis oryctolagi]|uniref:Uncharacterized protein n=1 Tax=Pneumocystis oryctolagi TaxID=42067 RepID=A0ACB7CCR4_9ASCO|nr:hypothetical protein PORY_001455 [Pneumocystis oryctolagi]